MLGAEEERIFGVQKSVQDLMNEARDRLSFIDICYLLGHALNKEKEFLLTHPEYVPPDKERKRWYNFRKRRELGEPSAYITGEKEFYSLTFFLNKHTFIPRPETEILVEEVISLGPRRLLDVGTGSGNIAIAVKYHLPYCSAVALDISKRALGMAKKNAERIVAPHSIQFVVSDYFREISEAEFDVIVSNPPYIKHAKLQHLPKDVRKYEPMNSLEGGEDGLDAYRAILREGKRFLAPGGKIALEIDQELIGGIISIAQQNGYSIEKTREDLSGADRVMILSS